MALNNVPLAGQSLAQTRDPINQNFSVIDTVFAIDHGDYNTGNEGFHNKVTFPVQGSAPVFAGTDNGLYELAYNNQSNTRNELFVHKQTSAGTADIPFTASILSQNSAIAANSSGWTYLPSGILMRWVNAAAVNGTTTITLPGTAPAFNAILSVQITPIGVNSVAVNFIDITNTTQFRVQSASATTANILVIGR